MIIYRNKYKNTYVSNWKASFSFSGLDYMLLTLDCLDQVLAQVHLRMLIFFIT